MICIIIIVPLFLISGLYTNSSTERGKTFIKHVSSTHFRNVSAGNIIEKCFNMLPKHSNFKV